MTEANTILVERAEGWARIVLNRPQRRNALIAPMLDDLATAVDELSADESVAAIVLCGAQGAFCAGVDLTELQKQPPHPWAGSMQSSARRAHIALYRAACPIVVALERFGINAGTAMALSGDLIVAGADAFLQIGEIQQGAGIPMNAAWMRIKFGESVLARMAYMGDRVAAAELRQLGIVHEVVDSNAVRARADAIAQRIAGFPAGSSRRIKSAVRGQDPIDPQSWFHEQNSNALLSAAQVRN